MTNLSGKRKAVSSEATITRTAKDFLLDPNKSSDYLKAVNSAVSASVAAAEAKIKRAIEAFSQEGS
jgi:hypothetical protein